MYNGSLVKLAILFLHSFAWSQIGDSTRDPSFNNTPPVSNSAVSIGSYDLGYEDQDLKQKVESFKQSTKAIKKNVEIKDARAHSHKIGIYLQNNDQRMLRLYKIRLAGLKETKPEYHRDIIEALLNDEILESLKNDSFDLDRLDQFLKDNGIDVKEMLSAPTSEYCKVSALPTDDYNYFDRKIRANSYISKSAYLQRIKQQFGISEDIKCKKDRLKKEPLDSKLSKLSEAQQAFDSINEQNLQDACIELSDNEAYRQAWDVNYNNSSFRVNYSSNIECINPDKRPEHFVYENIREKLSEIQDNKSTPVPSKQQYQYGNKNCIYSIEYEIDDTDIKELKEFKNSSVEFYLIPVNI